MNISQTLRKIAAGYPAVQSSITGNYPSLMQPSSQNTWGGGITGSHPSLMMPPTAPNQPHGFGESAINSVVSGVRGSNVPQPYLANNDFSINNHAPYGGAGNLPNVGATTGARSFRPNPKPMPALPPMPSPVNAAPLNAMKTSAFIRKLASINATEVSKGIWKRTSPAAGTRLPSIKYNSAPKPKLNTESLERVNSRHADFMRRFDAAGR